MSFVRVKKINNSEYAYLVENTWHAGKGSRQQVKAYLGKVIKPEKTLDLLAPELKNLSYTDAIRQVTRWTLIQHGFQEGTANLLMQGTTLADIGEGRFLNKKSPCAIMMNEGFLCNHTFKQALEFKTAETTEEKTGHELANVLLEAGLSIPQELFVQLFEKIAHKHNEAMTGIDTKPSTRISLE